MSSETLNDNRLYSLKKVAGSPESVVDKRTRLRNLILAENKNRQPENEFVDSQIKLALDLNLSTVRSFADHLRRKDNLTPKDKRDLSLFEFIISVNPEVSSDSSPPLTTVEAGKDNEEKIGFGILEKSGGGYTQVDSVQELTDRGPVKQNFPLVSTPEIRLLSEAEVIQREEDKRFKPTGLVIEAEPEIEKVSDLVPVEKPESDLENQPLFLVGSKVFWQGKKWLIENFSADEKYLLGRTGFLGFGKKEILAIPENDLEKEQFKKADSNPVEVAKLFRPGQELSFVQDDGREVVYKIKSRVGEMAFLGTLFFKDDGSRVELVRKNIIDICRLLAKE